MKTITSLSYLTGAAFLLLLTSCDKTTVQNGPMIPKEPYVDSEIVWSESDFSKWMSRAELQILMEELAEGHHFAAIEGRANNGFLQYRAVIQPFTDPRYQQWSVFWGLEEEELFKTECQLLRDGFQKHHVQAFADSTGKMRHQLVYLQPRPLDQQVALSTPAEAEPALPQPTESTQALLADNAQLAPAPVAPEPSVIPPPTSQAQAEAQEIASPPTETKPSEPEETPLPPTLLSLLSEAEHTAKTSTTPAPEEVPQTHPPTEAAKSQEVAKTIEVIEVIKAKDPEMASVPGVIFVSTQNPTSPSTDTPPIQKSQDKKVEVAKAKSKPAPQPKSEKPKAESTKPKIYKVVRGDTLGRIASRYGTSVRALMRANNLKNDRINIGQRLKIPQ